jgi:hypothetical protein
MKSPLLDPLDSGNLSPRRLPRPNWLYRAGFILRLMTLAQPATKPRVLIINEKMENSQHRSVCQFNWKRINICPQNIETWNERDCAFLKVFVRVKILCGALIEKLAVTFRWPGNYSLLLEPEGLLPCSEGLAIGVCPEPIQLVHTHTHYFKTRSNGKCALSSIDTIPNDVLLYGTKIVYLLLKPSLRSTRSTNLSLHLLITLIIFDIVYNIWSFSLRAVLHFPFTYFLSFRPKILVSSLLSNIPNLCSSLKDKF